MEHPIARLAGTLAACAAAFLPCAPASAQSPYAGTWETREILLKEASSGCRHLEIVVATFQLASGVNNTVTGNLARRFERSWWMSNPGCVMPGVNSQPGFTLRQDSWVVSSEPLGRDVQRLKGVYAGCATDCKEPWSPPSSFEIEMARKPGGLSAGALKGIVNATAFRDAYQTQVDAAKAAEAFMRLMRPILEGRCDEFLSGSIDAQARQRFPRDLTCAFGAQLRQLVPTVIRHERSHAHMPTLAQVMGMGGPLMLSEGDALVQRFLVINDAGNGIFLGAALRKQADGSWRVLDLVP